MKFKITKDKSLYGELVELHLRGNECETAAREWIKKRFGKVRPFANPEGVLWGGIAAVQMPMVVKGWVSFGPARYKLYAPKLSIAKKQLAALPVVTKQELKDLLQYANYPTPAGINTVPSVQLGKDYALVAVPDMVRGYEPLGAMEEILGSEYNRLYDEAEDWRNGKDQRQGESKERFNKRVANTNKTLGI